MFRWAKRLVFWRLESFALRSISMADKTVAAVFAATVAAERLLAMQSGQLQESCAQRVFQRLWQKYIAVVSDARTIEQSLRTKGDVWSEDHVAFRTLPGDNTGAHVLQSIFEALGYVRRDNYFFEDKQLTAFWMEPPMAQAKTCAEALPKVFISELLLDKFPAEFQQLIRNAVSQVKASPVARINQLAAQVRTGSEPAGDHLADECVAFLSGGTPWAKPIAADYEALRKHSEYAAWTLVFGFNINHFTVSVQLMKTFSDIHALNRHIQEDLKIPMNSNGGLTKGTPGLKLEQASTLAVRLPIPLQDGIMTLPYAFVEFAFRHPLDGKMADGRWNSYYQGFVTNNADKIFESTNLR